MLEENNTHQENPDALEINQATASNTRRKFLRKAAIGAPVVIASSARPAWATANVSGNISGNLSNQAGTPVTISGKNCEHWKQNYVGCKDKHYKKGDRSKGLKRQFKNLEGQYYARVNGSTCYSPHKTESRFGGNLCLKDMINSYDRFEKEIGAAFINASLKNDFDYPYHETDVKRFCTDVQQGRYTRKQVADALEKVHGWA